MSKSMSWPLKFYLQSVVLWWGNDPEAKSQIWLICINFYCGCKQVHSVVSSRFFIMHTAVIMIRKPPAQQPRTKFRGIISLAGNLTPGSLKEYTEPLATESGVDLMRTCVTSKNDLQMVCSIACDSNTAFLGYQERKTFSSSHLSSSRSALKGNLVELFEPDITYFHR